MHPPPSLYPPVLEASSPFVVQQKPGSFISLRCAAKATLSLFPKCISPAIIEPVFERITDVVETANNTGRLEAGMIIMKFLLPILLILEQGIFPVRRGVRA